MSLIETAEYKPLSPFTQHGLGNTHTLNQINSSSTPPSQLLNCQDQAIMTKKGCPVLAGLVACLAALNGQDRLRGMSRVAATPPLGLPTKAPGVLIRVLKHTPGTSCLHEGDGNIMLNPLHHTILPTHWPIPAPQYGR